ncbi:EamA family transporter [Streptacidiphilus sp. NEAU-YB345]|uniref:EamA family transporter n=1 Tax=Streptacidiphilus fuscans TaxID=2789292 RepID=A0A931B341_9ACTN|nr:EamA family transporter [Streptacidiphilus fuscans]
MALATLATVIWSGNFIIADAMARSIPPVQLAFWRWVIALCAVAPFGVRHLRREWAVVRAHWKFLSCAALLGVTLFNTLIYTAGRTSPATNMALLAAASPLVITLGARLVWKEAMGPRRWAGAALSLVGIVVLITRGSLTTLLDLHFSSGDLWMVAAMTTFALYSLMLKRKPAGLSGLSLLLATFGLGTAFLAPAYAWSLTTQGGFPVHVTTVSALLYVGVLSSAVAYFCWNKAIATVGVGRASVIYYLEPAVVALLAYLTLGEPINTPQLASMALIVIGVALSS